MPVVLDDLRRFAIRRSLFPPTTLRRAIEQLGFIQADPIRAPARAQDLTLRHRVRGYHAGDLERRYMSLGIEEDFFVNYGFVPRATQAADASALRIVGGCARQEGEGTSGLRRQQDGGASARGRRTLRAWHGHELLGWFIVCHDAPLDTSALPRRAAGGGSRGWHQAVRHPDASAGAIRCVWTPCRARSSDRSRRARLRAAAGGKPRRGW